MIRLIKDKNDTGDEEMDLLKDHMIEFISDLVESWDEEQVADMVEGVLFEYYMNNPTQMRDDSNKFYENPNANQPSFFIQLVKGV